MLIIETLISNEGHRSPQKNYFYIRENKPKYNAFWAIHVGENTTKTGDYQSYSLRDMTKQPPGNTVNFDYSIVPGRDAGDGGALG